MASPFVIIFLAGFRGLKNDQQMNPPARSDLLRCTSSGEGSPTGGPVDGIADRQRVSRSAVHRKTSSSIRCVGGHFGTPLLALGGRRCSRQQGAPPRAAPGGRKATIKIAIPVIFPGERTSRFLNLGPLSFFEFLILQAPRHGPKGAVPRDRIDSRHRAAKGGSPRPKYGRGGLVHRAGRTPAVGSFCRIQAPLFGGCGNGCGWTPLKRPPPGMPFVRFKAAPTARGRAPANSRRR